MSIEQDRLDVLEDDVQQLREALTEALEALESLVGPATGEAGETSDDPADTGEDTEEDAGDGAPLVSWAAGADPEGWEQLTDWIDWLIVTYETVSVRPCWPAHPGVVEELAAMFGAWRQAVAKSDTVAGDDDSMAFWHDRVLVPTLLRISGSFYPLRLCKDAHRDHTPAPTTDRELRPIGVRLAPTRTGIGTGTDQERSA